MTNSKGKKVTTSHMLGAPSEIAAAAEKIYDDKYKKEYAKKHTGEYVAINIQDSQAYVAKFAEDALREARKASPHGIFHLIRIGSQSTFKGSQVGGYDWCWRPLRQPG